MRNDSIDNLMQLTLVDGITVHADGKPLVYRVVHLRETNVADERAAVRLAERVVNVGGVQKLMVSDSDFKYALTMRHIDKLVCDGVAIPSAAIDLELFGKLSSHDLQLIEQRIFIIIMAAELRYGNLTQEQYDAIVSGQAPQPATAAAPPQPVGQGAAVGAPTAPASPGPELLADYAGDPAPGPATHVAP